MSLIQVHTANIINIIATFENSSFSRRGNPMYFQLLCTKTTHIIDNARIPSMQWMAFRDFGCSCGNNCLTLVKTENTKNG